MSKHIRLGDYPTTPLYNIKAVVQTTEISSSTLRAWERRYSMVTPQRSASGYRLYSDRDIAKIRWLKTQVDSGLSIRQAATRLETLTDEAGSEEATLLPVESDAMAIPSVQSAVQGLGVRSMASLQQELLSALIQYDEMQAEQTLSEAFALYTMEQVGEGIIAPVMISIGDLWHRGDISITTEHYATNYLMQRLMALLRVGGNHPQGPVLWVTCAPREMHEMGALLLALFLRRAGFQVHYLGNNLPAHDLVRELSQQRPAAVIFTASSRETAEDLRRTTQHISELDAPRPLVGYGGRIFNIQPELRGEIAGVYLGETAQAAVEMLAHLLQAPAAATLSHQKIN